MLESELGSHLQPYKVEFIFQIRTTCKYSENTKKSQKGTKGSVFTATFQARQRRYRYKGRAILSRGFYHVNKIARKTKGKPR